MPKIHVLHENPDWLPPLAAALDRTGAEWDEWFLVERALDLSAPPPDGVFYNRMSASSHTRGHPFPPEPTPATLSWLVSHRHPLVNGPGAPAPHLSQVPQDRAP